MLILVGPSASGKTEIANILINKYHMKRMVTYTTRDMRVGEENGVSYNFVSKNEFIALKKNNEFVETVEYNDNYYGTRKKDVAIDKIVILEPNGLTSFNKEMPNDVVSFYLNTSETERINRMIYRQDKMENVYQRIENDREAFKDVKNVDFFIDNENITLDELADKIYKLYKEKVEEKKMKVLVETSARHVHVTEEVLKELFGCDASLTVKKYLSQPGQFASEQKVTVVGPKREIANVSILGPVRKSCQVEISATDARSIGLDGVVRESGDIAGTPGCKLVGPCGEVELKEGVIVAKRHIHMTPSDAEAAEVKNGQIVSVKVENDVRSLVFGDVVIRVRDDFKLAMHIDTDESNAAMAGPGTMGEIVK